MQRYDVIVTDDWGYGRESFHEYFDTLEEAEARAEAVRNEKNPPQVEIVDELERVKNELHELERKLTA